MRDLALRHSILLHVIRLHFSMRLWNENAVRSKRIKYSVPYHPETFWRRMPCIFYHRI